MQLPLVTGGEDVWVLPNYSIEQTIFQQLAILEEFNKGHDAIAKKLDGLNK